LVVRPAAVLHETPGTQEPAPGRGKQVAVGSAADIPSYDLEEER
jgi:hypothetical protein